MQKQIEIVGAMQRAGVPMMAGTDLSPRELPMGVHAELFLLVEAGLTPKQALEAATSNPARFLGRDRELGTVRKGKIADLLLLDADPLASIRNTTKIRAVVANGRYYDRTALDGLRVQAAGPTRGGSGDGGAHLARRLWRRELIKMTSLRQDSSSRRRNLSSSPSRLSHREASPD